METHNDEIEQCQNIGKHELVDAVKSKAVMKFSPVHVPVHFNRLECNTNLNLPPSNWLTTSNSSHGLHQALYQTAGFASFRLGHMFPDCVGEVDVVSDAENIKKLLKMPYSSKGAISMIVHKVGNTLLLDEFDIQKYLLRKADNDWKWLRTFILEHILAYGEKEHNFCLKDKSREALQTKNLLSKFLYYSLKQSSDECGESTESVTRPTPALPILGPVLPEPKIEENVPDPKSSHVFNRNVVWTFEDIRMLIGTDMPIFGGPNRPCISLRLRDMSKPINVLTGIDYWLDNLMCNVPEVVMCYHLDGIVQKYEIIKTEDLPYLENSQFSPQVVRNVAQNILSFLKANATKAGHTYWLFKGRNDDVVKLYDLTTLCNKQSAAGENETQENPFTVPVGMLLYSVARNMKNTAQRITPKTAGNIRALLDNCIKLLPKEKYPQIVSSSHYILSDLHVPAGIDPKAPKFDEMEMEDTQSVYDDDEDETQEDCDYDDENFGNSNTKICDNANVAIQHICDTLKDFKSNAKHTKPTPLLANTEERCNISLQHISAGISCLQYFNLNQEEQFIKESEVRAKDEEKQRILHEEQNPNMAKPFKPIPLPYETLQRQLANKVEDLAKPTTTLQQHKKAKLKRNQSKELQIAANGALANQHLRANFNTQHFGSWNVHLKLLLLEKASLSYATLAEHNYEAKKYGASLKAIYMSCRCQLVVTKYMSDITSQQRCLFGRAGDCLFQMSKNWEIIDEYLRQFETDDDSTLIISEEIDKDLSEEVDMQSALIVPLKNLEQLMISSWKCYEKALEFSAGDDVNASSELQRRLGNVLNELGLKYMYWSQEKYTEVIATQLQSEGKDIEKPKIDDTDPTANEPSYMQLAFNSYDCLRRGIKAFSIVHDDINLAFLYCNMGRFMRLRAHLMQPNQNTLSLTSQKTFYNESFTNYEKAKDLLSTRKSNPELWDLVNWELSTATFTLAKQLQDFSEADNSNFAEASKEVIDLLQKSLSLCDVEHPGSRQILYTFRSGLIHKRIASFHYSRLRANCTDTSTLVNTTFLLCKFHYERAANILDSLKEVNDYLMVQLERISLHEFLADFFSHNAQKIKQLQAALDICLQSQKLFEYALNMHATSDTVNNESTMTKTASPNVNTTANKNNNDEFQKYILLFENRLQITLKTLIKLFLTSKDPKKLTELYKKMYMETLTGKRLTSDQQQTTATAQKMFNLLDRLKHLAASVVTAE